MTSKLTSTPVVLLCGGQGARMGVLKGLATLPAPRGHCTLLEHQIDALNSVGLKKVILVLGHGYEEYLKRVANLNEAVDHWCHWSSSSSTSSLEFQVVINPHPQLGPFSSLQRGIAGLLQDPTGPKNSFISDGLFVLPVDHPSPSRGVWLQISTAEQSSQDRPTLVRIPTYHGRGGHPIWIHPSFAKKLLEVGSIPHRSNGDSLRLDHQIRALEIHQVERVECHDPQILINLNSPEDLSKWLLSSARRSVAPGTQ